jgi:hypothetical protein
MAITSHDRIIPRFVGPSARSIATVSRAPYTPESSCAIVGLVEFSDCRCSRCAGSVCGGLPRVGRAFDAFGGWGARNHRRLDWADRADANRGLAGPYAAEAGYARSLGVVAGDQCIGDRVLADILAGADGERADHESTNARITCANGRWIGVRACTDAVLFKGIVQRIYRT